ncbi:MAG: hypothetical protein ACREO5_04400 [Candidatus Binatia bacterium]
MRFYLLIILSLAAAMFTGCSATQEPASPKKTFETYIKALKQKDTTTMKVLLSSETIKMHEQEAKAQGLTVDDIVKRETLVSPDQTTVEYRNEKIDGDKATLEVKNSYGSWETLPFVREDGVWKIDKKSYADQLQNDIDESDRKLEELTNQGRQP